MKAIAVFNNKGGVGKTTLLTNLSSYLAIKRNRSILIVDADPQCNATQSVFSDDAVAKLYTRKSFTLHSVVKPLAQGKGFVGTIKPQRCPTFGIDIIPGDPALSLEEDVLATDWLQATAGNVRGLRTTFLFTQLLSHCDAYDYVFFDMGPSLGSINRAVLIASDFFLTPMSTDIFSLKAIENIGTSLSTWRNKLTRALDDFEDAESELEIANPRWKLQFLGYVSQQYTAKTIRGEKQPVRAFEQIAKKVPTLIDTALIKKFTNTKLDAAGFLLGSIPTLHSLIPLSQLSRKPIFELRGTDGVVGAHFTKVKEYEEIISKIADRFESQLKALS